MSVVENIKLGFIGGGNMAEAITRGLLTSKLVQPSQILISDVSTERLNYLEKSFQVSTTLNNEEIIQHTEVIILCIKPQVAEKVLTPLQHALQRKQTPILFISILAGISLDKLALYFNLSQNTHAKVIRAMPNTPALVAEGAAGVVFTNNITEMEKKITTALLKSCSKVVVTLESESLLDAVTAVSGSGPAYVFHLIEAMEEAGVKEGLKREDSRKLAIQTIIGAGILANNSIAEQITPSQLRERVTSPGGTTLAALTHMKNNNWLQTTENAVRAAANRGRELSKL